MNPDDYTYSEHLKRLDDHAEANAKPCDLCKVKHIESNLTRSKVTGDLICWECITNMTLEQAVKYIKGPEDKCDPSILLEFIKELWPNSMPEGYQK